MYKPKTNGTLLGFARAMRHEPATAERLLWAELRGQMLGIKFRRQLPLDGFIVDFYCLEIRLIIELDGETHGGREDYDQARDQRLNTLGFKVLRFANTEVYSNLAGVLETIRLHLPLTPALSRREREPERAP